MNCDEQESELIPLRFAVAMATRLHRPAPAIDGVTVQTGDERTGATAAIRSVYVRDRGGHIRKCLR